MYIIAEYCEQLRKKTNWKFEENEGTKYTEDQIKNGEERYWRHHNWCKKRMKLKKEEVVVGAGISFTDS